MIDELNPMRDVMPRLDIGSLKSLMDNLPPPVAVRKIGKIFFEIYKVKDLFSDKFHSDELRNILIDARGSYYVYGPRPPLDEYDAKAVIYLARAYELLDDSSAHPLREEWISVRLVPPHGEPQGCGELGLFVVPEGDISSLVGARLFGGRSNYIFDLASSSRLCGLGPFISDGKCLELLGKTGHHHTALCYMLIREQYIIELDRLRLSYRYLTGIIHNGLADKSLTVKVGGRRRAIKFISAYNILQLAGPQLVRLDRGRPDLYVYRYPNYWLNHRQLVLCLEGLVQNKRLGVEVLSESNGCNLGNILTVRGLIEGSSMTGEELRVIIDQSVGDGPELKITPMAVVRRNLRWLYNLSKKP